MGALPNMFFDGSDTTSVLDLGPPEAMPMLMGDFYREPENVTRGLSLCSGAMEFNQLPDFLHQGDAFDKACIGELETPWSGLAKEPSCNQRVSRFEDGDEALPVPEDEFYQLEMTTVQVS